MSKDDPSGRAAADRIGEVERAVAELRRRAVLLVVAADGAAVVGASEGADVDVLARVTALGGRRPDVVITPERAATLRVRQYTEPVIAVPLGEADGATTVRHLADPVRDLAEPWSGPFAARRERLPQSYAAGVELAKLAGLLPSVVAAPIGVAPATDWHAWAGAHRLVSVDAADILAFEAMAAADLAPVADREVERLLEAQVPLEGAVETKIVAFRPRGLVGGGPEHLAIVVGKPVSSDAVLVRLHSECFTGDLLASLKCDCGSQLRGALAAMAAEGAGVLLYLSQEGRGIGLMNKLRAYALQDQGYDTVEANERIGFRADERSFGVAAAMLKQLGFARVRLLTNNPEKIAGLAAHGIEVVERVPHSFPANPHNAEYLATKKRKGGHLLGDV